MLNYLIYKLGQVKYNHAIEEEYRALKQSETYTVQQLKEQQLLKLKKLLVHAYEKSEFYRKHFDEAGVSPYDLLTLEDLKKVPFLTKSELRDNTHRIQIAMNEKLYYSRTSGSTGQPLVFYRNQRWDAVHRASIFRGYSWHGVAPYEKNGYLKGYDSNKKNVYKLKLLDALQNRMRIFSYEEKEVDTFLRKMKSSSYIEGYSSMIYEIAKVVNANREKYHFPWLKMVKGTSETIFDSYREEVKKAFGLNLISEYGSAESGIIAFECESGNMHITMEHVIVEEVDGEIIVTNLSSHSLPIIRYKLGDYIELESESYRCECGKQHRVIRSVLGRVGTPIKGKQGVYPSMHLYFVFKNLSARGCNLDYQGVQRRLGELEIKIEQRLSSKQRTMLETELAKYFKNDLTVTIVDEATLDRGKDKLKPFISILDASYEPGMLRSELRMLETERRI